jgi:hypothetical protein
MTGAGVVRSASITHQPVEARPRTPLPEAYAPARPVSIAA